MGAVAVPLNLNVLGETAAAVEVPARSASQLKAVVNMVGPTILNRNSSSERVMSVVTSGVVVLLIIEVG